MINRKEKTEELLKKHLPTFKKIDVDDYVFTPKCAFYVKGREGLHLQFFDSELNKKKDIYTELVDGELNPEKDNRTLYKISYNPYYVDEYIKEDKINAEGKEYTVYLIPVNELLAVDPSGIIYSYATYQNKLKEPAVVELAPKKSSFFPNFEDQFPARTTTKEDELDVFHSDDESATEILLRIATEFQKLAQIIK
jgi:hypothetical protein